MERRFVKPVYEYTEQTTLDGLLAEFLRNNPGASAEVASALGINRGTFDLWVAGTWTEGLKTKCFAGFQELTGIDLDALMVVEAKRRVWTKDPATRAFVTLERFPTRRDLIAEIKRIKALPLYEGTRLIAWQLGTKDEAVNRWSNDSGRPEAENLDLCVLGLSRGLIETGTRNDLAFRLAIRRVCGGEPEECLDLATFEDLVNAVFTRELKARGATIASQQTGINATTVGELKKWSPKSATKFPYGTIFNLVRAYVRTRWNELAQQRLKLIVTEFLDPKNDYAVREPVFDRSAPIATQRARVPVVPPASQLSAEAARAEPVRAAAHTVAKRGEAPTSFDTAVQVHRLVAHLRGQLLQVALDFPEIVGRLPMFPAIEIGETLHNMRWCLTGINIPDVGDWEPTDTDIEKINEGAALLRRAMLLLIGVQIERRVPRVKQVAPNFDELFLVFDALGVKDVVGFKEQMDLQREQAEIVRGRS